jgi:hypothetical protein
MGNRYQGVIRGRRYSACPIICHYQDIWRGPTVWIGYWPLSSCYPVGGGVERRRWVHPLPLALTTVAIAVLRQAPVTASIVSLIFALA